MKIAYDRKANATFIQLGEGLVTRTVPLSSQILVDYNDDGAVLGIEVLDSGPPPQSPVQWVPIG